ncbi:NERD domain-containing protein [Frankia sp. CNm7]|uniref:NERD domain-containing protein n=1 Tax=Frankia nepalensis TaxID=1836974 RepID=A0A937RLC7_9ACTN|nr:NERD domain-containing protein kinase family protein [Frankia nepalensis]MBL7497331.1 NERD domain-containing protein [Frankia nepalensis]MBL7509712.1 NERD domain-containing protein [Frankia nepalensis]MBL7516940.1 NERD domain-containing protein [Frankia nepalensis]MBL7629439.1 NERD domain-containing protein [Frankia nepalensis]
MGATIVRHGQWGGPGEEATARYLRDHLDERWTVVCGRQLVHSSGTRDTDFIVIGPNSVTVIEEKSWHGDLTGNDVFWYDRATREERGNPINQAVGAARILAGGLTHHNRALRNALKQAVPAREAPPHLVYALVVLSSPDVRVSVDDPRVERHVVYLDGCEQALYEIDEFVAGQFNFAPFHDRVLTHVTGLSRRPATPKKLGPYEIVTRLDPTPRGRRYVGRHHDGSIRVLLTLERQGLTAEELRANDNPLLREYHAMRRLAPLRRVFAVDPYFGVDYERMWVVPMHPPEPTLFTLGNLIRARVQPSLETFTAVAADSYAGLADIHAEGITHRALHPSRVWMDPETNRVTFSDFLIAKIADADVGTVHDADDADHEGQLYRAPECRRTAHAAGNPSDVYSLALCLLSWWEIHQSDPPVAPQASPSLPDKVRHALDTALAMNANDRPEARQVADLLAAYLAETTGPDPAAGARADRYDTVRRLGDGAAATTRLVVDRARSRYRTLKSANAPGLVGRLRRDSAGSADPRDHPRPTDLLRTALHRVTRSDSPATRSGQPDTTAPRDDARPT